MSWLTRIRSTIYWQAWGSKGMVRNQVSRAGALINKKMKWGSHEAQEEKAHYWRISADKPNCSWQSHFCRQGLVDQSRGLALGPVVERRAQGPGFDAGRHDRYRP